MTTHSNISVSTILNDHRLNAMLTKCLNNKR